MPEQPVGFPLPTPDRRKRLSVRRAERLARRAEAWGARVEEAREQGGAEVAAVQFDWTRAVINRLGPADRETAWTALAEAITRIREEHAQ